MSVHARVEGERDAVRRRLEPRLVPPESLSFMTKDGTVPS
jgi:hypothetical protein